MKFSLKTTILGSTVLAAGLNLAQFVDSYQQREAAFAGPYAQAAGVSDTQTATKAAVQPTPKVATPAPATPAATAPDPVATAREALARTGLNPDFAPLYLSVQARTGTPWQVLAAVHRVETGQAGTTTRTSYAGATGPMQFMPATFRVYAQDGNGDGVTDIHNIDDAMLSAGHYLAVGGANKGQVSTALYHYNHSWSYVSKVITIANKLGL